MSTTPTNKDSNAPGDKDPIKEVRERIIQLAREIEELSKSGAPPKTFFAEFLKRVVGAVGARAGAIWLRSDANRLELLVEQNLDKIGFNNNPRALAANQKLLTDVLSNGQACTHQPGETTAELPTEDMLVLAALQQNKDVVGVVQIFQRSDTPKQARPGFLQFVEQMTGYACRYLDRQANQQQAHNMAVGQVAEEFEQFVLQLHKTLDFKDVAFTAANDGRLLVGADRLSVAVLDGKKTVIRAISGQESVNQRANLVRKMTDLAHDVISSKENLTYTGKIDSLPPKIEKSLGDFVQESGSRMVLVIPVFEPDPLVKKDDEGLREKEKIRKPVGGLIVEQVSESQPKPGVQEKSELIGEHVGAAITNAKRYHRIFLMPLWRSIGKMLGFLEGRNGLKVALGFAALLLVILSLFLFTWDYRVEGDGKLMPVVQADVFAPWAGEVIEIKVESGQRVQKDDVLLVIQNKELEQQLSGAITDANEKEELSSALLSQIRQLATIPEQRSQVLELRGKLEQTKAELRGLTEQIAILTERKERLTVTAPISGIVSTFQIEQLLRNRPVERGQMLLEIKDDTGEWRLELNVKENRMGHLLDAQKAAGKTDLPIEFVLATDSEKTFTGRLSDRPEEMASRVHPSEDKSSVILIFAKFDKEQLGGRGTRIGAEVRAKINCGQKPLGYVLFGDVIEFVQKYFWLSWPKN